MSETKFTSGPWEIDPKLRNGNEGGRYSYVEVSAKESALWLAHVQTFSDDEGESAANSRLIAAAPDLYEALKATPCRYSRSKQCSKNVVDMCDRCAVLAKVEATQ